MGWLHDIYVSFFGASVLIAPEYLAVSLLLAYGLYRLRGMRGGFWAWALPRRIWGHRSHRVDIQLFVIGRLLVLVGLFNRVTATTLVAIWVAGLVGGTGLSGGQVNPWLMALMLLLAEDFTLYWVHRAYHRTPVIWPLHAVHHMAEVMTPVTAYRQHPLALVLTVVVVSTLVGLVQGVVIGLTDPGTTTAEVAGINAFIFGFSMLIANFRHSHIWISFGPTLERLIISPAQHQIHHSTAHAHLDRNYGENLAIWDWMFGTLYITRGPEDLTLGVRDETGSLRPGAESLGKVLLRPLKEMGAALRR